MSGVNEEVSELGLLIVIRTLGAKLIGSGRLLQITFFIVSFSKERSETSRGNVSTTPFSLVQAMHTTNIHNVYISF